MRGREILIRHIISTQVITVICNYANISQYISFLTLELPVQMTGS